MKKTESEISGNNDIIIRYYVLLSNTGATCNHNFAIQVFIH